MSSATTINRLRARESFLRLITLDPSTKTPLYRQLSDWFRRAIMGGQLRPGQRVPSTRKLAAELKISRVPVLNAYEQLHAEGYLETFVGSGTYVATFVPAVAPRSPNPGVPNGSVQLAGRRDPRRISQQAASMLLAALQDLDLDGHMSRVYPLQIGTLVRFVVPTAVLSDGPTEKDFESPDSECHIRQKTYLR